MRMYLASVSADLCPVWRMMSRSLAPFIATANIGLGFFDKVLKIARTRDQRESGFVHRYDSKEMYMEWEEMKLEELNVARGTWHTM